MGKVSRDQFIREHIGYLGPRIVADGHNLSLIKNVAAGKAKIKGRFGKLKVTTSSKKPYLVIHETNVSDDSGSIRTIWFNTPRIDYIDRDKDYIFLGKVEDNRGVKTLVDPIFTTVDDVKKWQAIYDNLKS